MTTQIELKVSVTIDGKDSDSAGDNLRAIVDEAGLDLAFLHSIRQQLKTYDATGDWRIVRVIALTVEGQGVQP